MQNLNFEQLKAILPPGLFKEIQNLDLGVLIANRARIHQKDMRRIVMFGGEILQRALAVGLQVGVIVGREPTTAGAEASALLVAISTEARQFAVETMAIIKDFADEKPAFADIFKDEREHLRIYAKRNQLSEAFLKELGVDERTPDDYPQAFKDKYLAEMEHLIDEIAVEGISDKVSDALGDSSNIETSSQEGNPETEGTGAKPPKK